MLVEIERLYTEFSDIRHPFLRKGLVNTLEWVIYQENVLFYEKEMYVIILLIIDSNISIKIMVYKPHKRRKSYI